MNARYEIYQDANGKFRFRLIAPNRETLAVSEGFESKQALMKTLRRIKGIAHEAILAG